MQSDSLAQSGSDRVSGSSATEWQILSLARRVRSNTSVLRKVMLVSLQPSGYSPALSNDNKKCNDKTRKNSFQKGEKFVKKIPWTEIEIITKLSIIFVNIRSIWLSTWMRITGIICVFCCSDWSGCALRDYWLVLSFEEAFDWIEWKFLNNATAWQIFAAWVSCCSL